MNRINPFNHIEVGVSELKDGTMRFFGDGDEGEVIKNQEKLAELMSLKGDRVSRVRTVYDGRESYTEYYELTEENLKEFSINQPEKEIKISDGLVTRCKEIGILLPLADCLGAVFYDEEQQIVGLLHAGRHNIEQGGPEEFVKFLKEQFNCDVSKLKVYFSPCARNYPIFKFDNEKLIDVALGQLLRNGVSKENIVDSEIDVVADRDYPSCSRGDNTDRFAIIVKQN